MATLAFFNVRIRVSNLRLNVTENENMEHHPIIAFVGTSALRTPTTNRLLASHLKAKGAIEFTLQFEVHDQVLRRSRQVPIAIMPQLHTHRLSDDDDLTEVNSAVADKYIWLSELAQSSHVQMTDVAFKDFCAITEDTNFHSMPSEVKQQHGPDITLPWTTKALLDIECWLDVRLPYAISAILSPDVTSLDAMHQVLNQKVLQQADAAVASMRHLPSVLGGLTDFDVQYYNIGADLLVPAAIAVANQRYAEETSEALYESRLHDVMAARKFDAQDVMRTLKRLVKRFQLYDQSVRLEQNGQPSIDNTLAPSDFDLECVNLLVEALLTMPACALPYTYDKSVARNRQIDVERLDNNKRHRSVDCEDTSIEISLTHEDLVRRRGTWRNSDGLIALASEILANYVCIVTRVVTSPTINSKNYIDKGTLHICPLLVLKHHLYRWIEAGAGTIISKDKQVALLAGKSIAFRPTWCDKSSERGTSQPSNYYVDLTLPDLPSIDFVVPPGRIVLIADGCTPMIPSQGPPLLTHPQTPDYFTEIEHRREAISKEIMPELRKINKHLEYEYPLRWNTELTPSPYVSQSNFYHRFVTFSVRNPLLFALANFRDVPSAPQTLRTVLDFVFLDESGALGVPYDTLVDLESSVNVIGPRRVHATPRLVVDRGFVTECVDLLALMEPVYPLYPRDLSHDLARELHSLDSEVLRQQYSNVFLDFPLHIASFSSQLLQRMQSIVTVAGGAAKEIDLLFLNMGACSNNPGGARFIDQEEDANVELVDFHKSLWEIQRLAAHKSGIELLRTSLPLSTSTQKSDLWYMILYERILEQPLGVVFIRMYFDDSTANDIARDYHF